MKKLILLLLIASFGCERKPDFIKDGKGYWVNTKCVKSHVENKFGYHYGYSIRHGEFCWHMGTYDETICDSMVTDTIEIQKK
jgi:hypothetical protein